MGLCPYKAKPSGRAQQAPAEKKVVSMPKRHLEAATASERAKIRKSLGEGLADHDTSIPLQP